MTEDSAAAPHAGKDPDPRIHAEGGAWKLQKEGPEGLLDLVIDDSSTIMSRSTGLPHPLEDDPDANRRHANRIELIRSLLLYGGKITFENGRSAPPDHATALTLAEMVHAWDMQEWGRENQAAGLPAPRLLDLLRNVKVRGKHVPEQHWLLTADQVAQELGADGPAGRTLEELRSQMQAEDLAGSQMVILPDVEPYTRFEPRDVARLRRDVCAWLQTAGAREYFQDGMDNGRQAVITEGMRHDPAGYLARAEYHALADAPLYFIDRDMCQLTAAAYPTMPPFVPGPADLPSRNGFAIFAAPLSQHFTELYPGQHHVSIRTDAGTISLSQILRDIPTQIIGVSWRTIRPRSSKDRWQAGNVWMTFYAFPAAAIAYTKTPAAYREVWRPDMERFPAILPDNELLYGLYDPALMPGEASDYEDALPENVHGVADWIRALLAAFTLNRQKAVGDTETVRIEPRKLPKAKAKRTGQKYAPADQVLVMKLRHQQRPSRDPAAGNTGSSDGTGKRQYGIRWFVRGFWRNTWYPASGMHRPQWIAPHIKGPEGAPLRTREKVLVVSPPTS